MRLALLPLIAPLRERALYAALAIGLLLWVLAYQLPYRVAFAIGGDVATGRRHDDAPFLLRVNDPEPDRKAVDDWRALPPHYGYRWTTSDTTLLLPGLGGGSWLLEVGAGSGRTHASAPSVWLAAGQRLALEIAPIVERPRVYRIIVPAKDSGDLSLQMLTPPYAPPGGDPRDLGFVLTSLRAAQAGAAPRLPALALLGWLALALALAYPQLRAAGLALRGAFAASVALALLVALLLAQARLALTGFAPTLAALLACCLALTAALRMLAFAWFRRRVGAGGRFLAALIGLVALAWALRLGGMLHPQYRFSDVRLHANNLLDLSLGAVYFTEGLPAESGGGKAPYPPGMYLVLAPLQLLFAPSMDARVLLLKGGVALLDSLVSGLIGLALWRGAGARAALLGAALYVAPPPLLLSFSVGEFANIGGQALALPALVALALWVGAAGANTRFAGAGEQAGAGRAAGEQAGAGRAAGEQAGAGRAAGEQAGAGEHKVRPYNDGIHCWYWLGGAAGAVALLCVGLLAHLGVAISLACALAGLWLVRLVAALRGGARAHRALAALTLLGLLAGAFVAAIYYTAPQFVAIFAARLAGGAALPVPPGETALARALGALGNSIRPAGKIVPLLALAGALGLALLLARRHAAPLGALAAAWWLGALLSLGLLAAARQGVRWDLFFYPGLCLSAAPALGALWRRGRSGRLVALAVALFPICYGVAFWVAQVRDNYH